jgi:serine O-acetyltransferase
MHFRPETLAIVLYRHAHYHYSRQRWRLARFFYRLNLLLTGADIHPRSEIGPGCVLVHTIGFVFDGTIGANATIFGHCVIQPAYDGVAWSDAPRIGDNCTLCLQCSVIGPVSVADSSTLGAFAYVDFSVTEPGATVGVSPAVPVKIYPKKK